MTKLQGDKQKKIKYFTQAWWYLQDHKILEERNVNVESCLDIFVTKVNPEKGKIDKDDTKNTETEVWLEFGFPEKGTHFPTHDIRLDCGAETFEQAIIKLANLVKKYYDIPRR